MTHQGTVKSWSDDKGFGFILPRNGGGDVFVHRNVIGAQSSLVPGKDVSYDFQMENDKPKATSVSGQGVGMGGGGAPKRQGGGGGGGGHAGGPGRLSGVVKSLNNDKGYGFIAAQDGSGGDLFMLTAQVTGNVVPGARVTYSLGVNPKTQKPWAESVYPESGGGGGGGYGGQGGYNQGAGAGYGAGAGWQQPQAGGYGGGFGGFGY